MISREHARWISDNLLAALQLGYTQFNFVDLDHTIVARHHNGQWFTVAKYDPEGRYVSIKVPEYKA